MPQDPMLLAHLESFIEVARHGNVSRAAEALFLTQPAITARLKSLEHNLGAELFVRTPRGMKLSDAGRALLPFAERTLATVEEARHSLANLQGEDRGELVIAAAPVVSTYVLPGILRAFRSTHPSFRLGVQTSQTEGVVAMVLRGEAHIGIGRLLRHPEVALIPVFDDEAVFVVGAQHAFAARNRVRMDEVAAQRLVLFDSTSTYYELTIGLFRQAGFTPASTMRMDNVEAAKKMVQQGLGVALLPRMALSAELKAGSLRLVRPVGVPPLKRPIVAFRRKDAGPLVGPAAGILDTIRRARK